MMEEAYLQDLRLPIGGNEQFSIIERSVPMSRYLAYMKTTHPSLVGKDLPGHSIYCACIACWTPTSALFEDSDDCVQMSSRTIASVLSNINTYLVSYTWTNILETVTAALQRINVGHTPATSEQAGPFFRLPPEMRQAIYEAAILDDLDDTSDSGDIIMSSSSINLLQTCRQVKIEAEPIRYQRPQSFTSQAKLFVWLDRSERANLERVRTLSLHLTDVDLSLLLDPVMTSPRRHSTAWSIYQAELSTLDLALRALPNLSDLTVLPLKNNRSMLVKQFYRTFLTMIPLRCTKLKRLELHDTQDILQQAPALSNIAELVFTEAQRRDQGPGTHDQGQRELSPEVRIMKVETDEPMCMSPLPSPRTKRRSRITRVVSD